MENHLKILFIIFIPLLFSGCKDITSKQDLSKNIILSTQLDSLVNSNYQNNLFSGSVLVADKGKILLNKEYGFQGLDSTKPITSESVFEIASLSKQFTAVLIIMLKEDEKLDYDDNILKYFPNLPYDNITIRHLLTHSSGLSEKEFFMWAGQNMDPTKIYTNKLIISYLEQEKPELAYVPGTKWEYSNVGYFLLALILEQITEKHYIQLLNEKIFDRLEMANTGIFSQDHKGNKMDNYVFGKVFNPADSVYVSSFGMAWSDSLYGGVGILSNTTDLFKWDRALNDNRLVNQQILLEAFDPFILSDGSSSEYGFGWYVREDYMINGEKCGKRVDHNGLWPGYESSIVRYNEKDKTIIILSNQAPSSKDKLVEEISKLLFEKN